MIRSPLNLTRISVLIAFTSQIGARDHASIGRMVAAQVRSALAIGAAGATLLVAWLLAQRSPCALEPRVADPCDPVLTARLGSSKMLTGNAEQELAVTIAMPSCDGGEASARPPLSLAIVIDRSASMHGTPIPNAQRGAI